MISDPRMRKLSAGVLALISCSEQTLEEIGQQFDVTRERIRQIEAKALKKLAHPNRSDLLRDFLSP